MVKRTLAKKMRAAAARFPVVTVTGPRQSGKTTLVRNEFKEYAYVSLELPDQRAFAREDPRGFLAQFKAPLILDEVQHVPDLLSYIQVRVDDQNRPGQFILTGSHHFLLVHKIAQSLAGRCAILHLLPFSMAEFGGRLALPPERFGTAPHRRAAPPDQSLMDILFTGFYPRIHDQHIPPRDWLGSYYQTYLERDVRALLNVGDMEAFSRFVRLCAGRSGQILNLTAMASDCGITHTTARRWLSVLEASFIIVLLRPWHQNFGKRLIKNPKLYFLDSGLLCYLLRVSSPEELHPHAARGAIFEGFVLSELYKNFVHRGELPPLFFWRDASGHEVDFLIDLGSRLIPIEVKSAQTVAADFFAGLTYWRNLSGSTRGAGALVYGGDRLFKQHDTIVYPWFAL